MKMPGSSAEAQDAPKVGVRLFAAIVAAFDNYDVSVERVKLFGYDCLRVNNKIFAKIDKGRLVMKLPKQRIEALVMAGHLEPYDGKRGQMKLWVVLDSVDEALAVALAAEAKAFVGAGGRP